MSLLGRFALISILIACGTSVLCLRTIRGAEDQRADEESQRKAYADKIRETYSFPFGKDKIALPGNAAAVGGEFLPASAFPDAAYCGHCHQEAYHEWRQSPLRQLPQPSGCSGWRSEHRFDPRSVVRPRRPHVHDLPLHSECRYQARQWKLCDGRTCGHGRRTREPHTGNRSRCRDHGP